MHIGKNYSFKEVILWTRRDIFTLLIVATIPTVCYAVFGWKWLSIPWLPIALLGTAVAFVVGFANNAAYDRMWEARKAWGAVVNASRSWGIMIHDYLSNVHTKTPVSDEELRAIQRGFIMRHVAWLAALRFQLRQTRVWESITDASNAEFKNKFFIVDEHEQDLQTVLSAYLTADEVCSIMATSNKAAQIIALQSQYLEQMAAAGVIEHFRYLDLQKMLVEFYNQQGVSERIKNFPYPRQYATVNVYFIKIFIALIPLGMLQEFEKMGEHLVWLTIPFSALSAWIFTTLEKIGQSSSNPFEGAANDVPITAMSRAIEIDLLEMFDESIIPPPVESRNNILL